MSAAGGAEPAAAPPDGGNDGQDGGRPSTNTVTVAQSGAFKGTKNIKPDPQRRAGLAAHAAAHAHSGVANPTGSDLRRHHSTGSGMGGGTASSRPMAHPPGARSNPVAPLYPVRPTGNGRPDPSMLYSNAHPSTTPLSAGPSPVSPPGMATSMPRGVAFPGLPQQQLPGGSTGVGHAWYNTAAPASHSPFGTLTPPASFSAAAPPVTSQTQPMLGTVIGEPSQQQILQHKQIQLQFQALQRQPQPVVDPVVARRFIQQQQHLQHQRRAQAHQRQMQQLHQRQQAALLVKTEESVTWESNKLEDFFQNEVGILDLDGFGPASGSSSQSAPGSRRTSAEGAFATVSARRVSTGGAFTGAGGFARRPSDDPESFERRMSGFLG